MKKITLIQNDDGTIQMDGQDVGDIESAIAMISQEFGGESEPDEMGEGELSVEGEEIPSEESMEGESENEIPMEEEAQSESIGKTLGSKMPVINKKKMGMRPKQKASFEDYGI